MENRIKQVMSDVLNVDIADINEDTSPETLEEWDSLKQMNLIVSLEEEFNLEFTDEEIEDLLNFKLIKLTIAERI